MKDVIYLIYPAKNSNEKLGIGPRNQHRSGDVGNGDLNYLKNHVFSGKLT